jgi:hypothetical protein
MLTGLQLTTTLAWAARSFCWLSSKCCVSSISLLARQELYLTGSSYLERSLSFSKMELLFVALVEPMLLMLLYVYFDVLVGEGGVGGGEIDDFHNRDVLVGEDGVGGGEIDAFHNVGLYKGTVTVEGVVVLIAVLLNIVLKEVGVVVTVVGWYLLLRESVSANDVDESEEYVLIGA